MPSLDEKLALLFRLPWTLSVAPDPSDGSLTAAIAELPEFVASGVDEPSLVEDIHGGLRALFHDYLAQGEDSLPLPVGAVLPWREDPRVHLLTLGLFGEAAVDDRLFEKRVEVGHCPVISTTALGAGPVIAGARPRETVQNRRRDGEDVHRLYRASEDVAAPDDTAPSQN